MPTTNNTAKIFTNLLTNIILKNIKTPFLLVTALCLISMVHGTPDLTIVGFLDPNGGLGKLPISIMETLGETVSINFISTWEPAGKIDPISFPINTQRALHHLDQEPGHVAILTDAVWHLFDKPSDKIPKNCKIKIAYSMIESTQIPTKWASILNKEFDAVVVPDKYLLKVYQNCGVTIPIFILPIPLNLSPFFEHPPHKRDPLQPFIFGDASANKNPEALIQAFAKAFKNSPNVHLVMRAITINDDKKKFINQVIEENFLTNVTIEEGILSSNEYVEKLASFDCYVNLSPGEGFSNIPRESLAMGIPVIITNNTASKTICKTGFVYAVQSDIPKNFNNVYDLVFGEKCGVQFDCEVDDAAHAMLEVYHNYSLYLEKAAQGRKWVRKYDINNKLLQTLYLSLVKPLSVSLGRENVVTPNKIITNSSKLHKKFQELIKANNYENIKNILIKEKRYDQFH